jgi:hypothetical protein
LSLLPFLLPVGDEKRKKSGHRNQYDIKESVEKILQEVDSITDVEEKKEVLQLLIGLYSEQPGSRDLPHGGELPFFNGDSFQSVHYIVSKDSLVLSADFTVLGTVEILARD